MLLLVSLITLPAFAQNSQVSSTDKGTLDVSFFTEPGNLQPGDTAKLKLDFINPQTEKTQVHIDYYVTVLKDGSNVFGPTNRIHTGEGVATIPVEFIEAGTYVVLVEVDGILFTEIPREAVSFSVGVGEAVATNGNQSQDNGGGCLIATAAFGSELSPQVQQLREVRDSIVMKTDSGSLFMTGFNQFYYSFSPAIADYERQNPVFKEIIKTTITPMISTLSLLNYVEIDSDVEMLGVGLGIIFLNLGIYFGIPTVAVLKLYQYRR